MWEKGEGRIHVQAFCQSFTKLYYNVYIAVAVRVTETVCSGLSWLQPSGSISWLQPPSLHVLVPCRWNPMRIMLNNFRYSLMDYKFKGEQALRASGGVNVGWQGLNKY